jgi:hypothetical protein
MKNVGVLVTIALLAGAAATMAAAENQKTLVVTSSNTASNQLLVYDTAGALLQTLPTLGQGGVGGNAGGVAIQNDLVAVVNFGSQSVSLFQRSGNSFDLRQTLTTVSAPVSVTFGKDHLYILCTATVESHPIRGVDVGEAADGVTSLLRADGSAAQVGSIASQLVITEKSGAIEVVDLRGGVVVGPAVPVDIPSDSDTPLGLVTRGANGYVTIAHSDEVSLIKNGQLVALVATGSGFPTGPGQQAPCWITLTGPYLFTSNSPSHTISRLIATGQSILLDVPIAAHTTGAPLDIAADGGVLAVVESTGGGQSHLTQFAMDDEGTLTQTVSIPIASAANGVVISLH